MARREETAGYKPLRGQAPKTPEYQTAAGVTDMIAHICERYFSGEGPAAVTDSIAVALIGVLTYPLTESTLRSKASSAHFTVKK